MKATRLFVGCALVLSAVVLGATQAGATGTGSNSEAKASTCTGTLTSPGLVKGTYAGNVVVSGYCVVNGGPTVIKGDLRIAPNAALNATFALNDVAGKGTSSLTVRGDVNVENGAALAMGCEPNFSPCSDDPAAATGGTLASHDLVQGSIFGHQALGMLVHASTVKGNVTQSGGGGGLSCVPPSTGIFSVIHSPVFSDYEDNTINGDLTAVSLQTCWFGALRNSVGGDVTANRNTMGDSDASEVLANHVAENIVCFNNSPAVQYGDSMSSPNIVEGHASGECGFAVLQPDPSPSGPLTHISLRG